MSPPKNSDKLADAFKEYLPPDSRFMFLLIEKSGKGAWVSSMSSIQRLDARVELLEHALTDAKTAIDPDAKSPRELDIELVSLRAKVCVLIILLETLLEHDAIEPGTPNLIARVKKEIEDTTRNFPACFNPVKDFPTCFKNEELPTPDPDAPDGQSRGDQEDDGSR